MVWGNGTRRRGVVVTTSAQFHLTKPVDRFYIRSNPIHVVSKICDGENLLTVVPAGTKANHFSSVNHSAKIIQEIFKTNGTSYFPWVFSLSNFAKFTGKYLWWIHFLLKLQAFTGWLPLHKYITSKSLTFKVSVYVTFI